MRRTFIHLLLLSFSLSPLLAGDNPPVKPLPSGVVLVPGAIPSASDRLTPVPEGGTMDANAYHNDYFGLTYPVPENWNEPFKGPLPSDGGEYVLAQLVPGETFKGPSKGTLLVTAQDLFFGSSSAANAAEWVKYGSDHLPSYYEVERAPAEARIAGRPFTRFDYGSSVAGLHWFILTTEIRCHAVQFIFSSRDPQLLDTLVAGMEKMKTTGDGPACVADYAGGDNIISKVDPVLLDRKYNVIPVRIVIDKNGSVKHVHVLSAFAEQSRVITDAVMQWKFKPYVRNGQPAEVETGIVFGSTALRRPKTPAPSTASAGQ